MTTAQAIDRLGFDHAMYVVERGEAELERRISDAWFVSNLERMEAYLALKRALTVELPFDLERSSTIGAYVSLKKASAEPVGAEA